MSYVQPKIRTSPDGQSAFERCPIDRDCPHCGDAVEDAEDELDWSFLDAAYCISLKTRNDRFALAVAEFHKIGLCRIMLFYRPDRHPTSFPLGCWESHRAVALHALESGLQTVLICEDDVLFTRKIRNPTLSAIRHALDTLPPDWTIFFLGHWPLRAVFVRRNILRTSSACSHAYIASSRLLCWLRDHPWGTPGVRFSRLAGRCIDSAYAKLNGTYAYFPMLAIQRPSRSDHFRGYPRERSFKLKHLVTHSSVREQLLSKLMRPIEILVALSSPVFFLLELLKRKPSCGR